ncbi:3-methylcrotonyl-CoA carboxylase [Oleiphilus sp. HI0118]|nr:3-methylcrotonyl-CoA carboxylase [Oleiphilus sp. HI0118]KZZ40935.1 3-methylcrotonyl-CoA carboxylase [Oleiphilus sp. HI0118]
MFSKILIANRGEIAVRVIRTAKDLGYQTVAVFSEADRYAPHVIAADEAVCIGAAAVNESYLVSDKIIDAAKRTGAGAVHPGYGFLSENSGFAKACEEAGIVFIGPPAGAIELMGSKRLSKIAMLEAKVPCIPGYEGADQNIETLLSEAKRIGFPLMVKASAGGGGRGMRLVHKESELEAQINTARSEAENAFGSGELILERAVISPRHIEIQVFADQHGNAVYLGERDCSIQRRHQKVVEEAPSPFVDPALRQRMGEAAVQAAKACDYVGAGTVEFLVDQEKNFYFLEMNTRLQVEHPVTELVTGTDLVEWQINVAAGAPLPKTQEDITLNGHAIEVRLYAEDPRNQFLPQTGNILRWQTSNAEGVRIDAGIEQGQEVSPFYDPMLAKLIAYGANREEARRRLLKLLRETVLFGVTVNTHFLSRVLDHQRFTTGEATTAFIEQDFAEDESIAEQEQDALATAIACMCLHHSKRSDGNVSNMLMGWSNSASSEWPYTMRFGESEVKLFVEESKGLFTVRNTEDDAPISLRLVSQNDAEICFEHDGIQRRCNRLVTGDKIYLRLGSEDFVFEDVTHVAKDAAGAAGSGQVQASMDGAIIKVFAEPGQAVAKGDTLVILEAMKMEHPLKADVDGTVESVLVKAGDQVKLRQLLVEVAATEMSEE